MAFAYELDCGLEYMESNVWVVWVEMCALRRLCLGGSVLELWPELDGRSASRLSLGHVASSDAIS